MAARLPGRGGGADIVTLGKALRGGLPLSVAIGPAAVLDAAEGSSLLTTAGNPVCAAAGRAVLRIIEDEQLPARADRLGRILSDRLADLASRHLAVRGTRSGGLVGGIELADARPQPRLSIGRGSLGPSSTTSVRARTCSS